MRVIAGRAKGTRLMVPKGTVTRPTADRVREALFSILGERVAGSKVLDLFAGSGALGIEALSRGASEAVFVDNSAAAIAAMRDNLERCHLSDRGRVTKADAGRGLGALSRQAGPFNLIFADPPYKMIRSEVRGILHAILASGLVEAAGWIVLEHPSKEQPPVLQGAEIDQSRPYGDTALTIYRAIHGAEK